jgi:hypothetical protein
LIRWLTSACLVLGSATVWADGVQVSTTPSPIVLGQVKQVSITVSGVPGSGPARAAVNVGRVEAVEPADGGLRVRYRPPDEVYPQRLCLMLWRARQPRVLVLRIPLLGTAWAPIRTRRNSQVTLKLGDRVFGPQPSGPHGRLKMRVVVPPGVVEGQVAVVDEAGLETRKPVPIRAPPYNLLALAVRRQGPPGARPKFRIAVAAATPHRALPRLEAFPAETALKTPPRGVPLRARTRAPGHFTSAWEPRAWPSPGTWEIRAWLPGLPLSARREVVSISPPPAPPPPGATPAGSLLVRRTSSAPARDPDTLRLNVAIAGGIMHNTGAILSPRISAELGADHTLGPGRIGGRLSGGVSWTGQTVTVVKGLDTARSRVLLVPLALQLTYRLPLGPVAPYAAAGLLTQLVHSRTEGPHTGQGSRLDWAIGGTGLAGVDWTVGPGALFLQAGFQYSRVSNEELKLLAGGVIVESGYRLEFGIR